MQIYHNQNQPSSNEKQLTIPRLPLIPTTPTLPPASSSISTNNTITMGSSGSHRSLDVKLPISSFLSKIIYLGKVVAIFKAKTWVWPFKFHYDNT